MIKPGKRCVKTATVRHSSGTGPMMWSSCDGAFAAIHRGQWLPPMRILLIEDYHQLTQSIVMGLAEFGFGVDLFATSAMCSRNELMPLSSRVLVRLTLTTLGVDS
jgi:hypothetical protein